MRQHWTPQPAHAAPCTRIALEGRGWKTQQRVGLQSLVDPIWLHVTRVLAHKLTVWPHAAMP